jgi:hypothetical protein
VNLTGSEQGQVMEFAMWVSVLRYQDIRFLEQKFANHLSGQLACKVSFLIN